MSRFYALLAPLAALALFSLFTAPKAQADSSTSTTQPSGYTVTITVKDATGKPVVGAHVDLVNPPPKAAKAGKGAKGAAAMPKGKAAKPAPPVAQGVTDSSGIVTFPNIASGSYEATVSPATPGKKKGAAPTAAKPAAGKAPVIEATKAVVVASADVSVDIALKPAGKKGASGATAASVDAPATDAPATDTPATATPAADAPAAAGN